jgi:glycopeptide antibiotics resistance protein
MMYILQGILLYKTIGIFIILSVMYLLLKKFFFKSNLEIFDFLLIITFDIYLIKLISICFFPIITDKNAGFDNTYIIFNLVPFNSIYNIAISSNFSTFAKQILGNLILLAPFSIFLSFFLSKTKPVKILIYSILFSIFIELTQFLIDNYIDLAKSKIIDIDDVILNSFGAAIGILIYILIKGPIEKLRSNIET